MRIGRLILTHRRDLLAVLKSHYLPARTDFLVIAYDRSSVGAPGIAEGGNFRLLPYDTHPLWKLDGRQFRVWLKAVRAFPRIEGWVIHDYDLAAKPTDAEIFSHLGEDEYAMIGQPFPVWREGMKSGFDTYPFPQSHRFWGTGAVSRERYQALVDCFPVEVDGVKSFYAGYSDFLAASSASLLLLDDRRLDAMNRGGSEQVPHAVWGAKGIKAVDLRRFYKSKIRLDGRYLPPRFFNAPYDFLHPLKFWPGGRPETARDRIANAKYSLADFAKRVVGYRGWHF